MKTDLLLAHLRNPYSLSGDELHDTRVEAADVIERLQAANAELKAALRRIETWDFNFMGDCVAMARRVARTALAAIEKERE